MKITEHSVVSLYYTLKNDKGETLDSSEGKEPLTYLHGVGGLIPGLEKELNEKAKGEKFSVVVKPEEAYGNYDEKLLKLVSKEGFQGEEEMKVGMQVQLDTEHGPAIARVTKIEDKDVTLDLNHPLADVTLHFDIEVADLREATKEEIEHGHVHGPGGHQH